MLKSYPRFLPLLVPGAVALLAGCGGYQSQYIPPPDGRPRLVWDDNKVVPTMANVAPSECTAAVDEVAEGGTRKGRSYGHVTGGYYVPVHHVTVVHVHGPPIVPVPHPVVFHGGTTHTANHGGGKGGLGGLGGSGGSGGSGDLGKAAVVVAVLAIAVLPFVALGLATGRPEPEAEVAAAIDRVNAQTDLARTEGSPCDELQVAGQVAQ